MVMTHFPCKYLGLPLSLKKLNRAQLQPLIEKVADHLPGWKADLISRAGLATYVQSVITSTLIYYSMALELRSWCLKALDKIRRKFLWRGRKELKWWSLFDHLAQGVSPKRARRFGHFGLAIFWMGPQGPLVVVGEN